MTEGEKDVGEMRKGETKWRREKVHGEGGRVKEKEEERRDM